VKLSRSTIAAGPEQESSCHGPMIIP
jgi:hypothetical protein